MARFILTDFEWSVIEHLLPTKVRVVNGPNGRRGDILMRNVKNARIGRTGGALKLDWLTI